MRYLKIDNINFTTINGDTFLVKDIREYPTYQKLGDYPYLKDEDIDEIISRRDYYKDGAEDLSYAVVDFNIEKLTENGYDLNKLKKLRIPVI